MKKFFVYLLEIEKDGNFYIGQTDDVSVRLRKHNAGLVKSTKNRRPLKLLGFKTVASRGEALELEKSFKVHSDKKLGFIKQFKQDFSWSSRKGDKRKSIQK